MRPREERLQFETETLLYGDPVGGMSIRYYPLGGEDRPDDMAEAWLTGNMVRYEKLKDKYLTEQKVRDELLPRLKSVLRKFYPSRIKRNRGIRAYGRGRRVVDRARILELSKQGLGARRISRLTGVSTSHVSRIVTMSERKVNS